MPGEQHPKGSELQAPRSVQEPGVRESGCWFRAAAWKNEHHQAYPSLIPCKLQGKPFPEDELWPFPS